MSRHPVSPIMRLFRHLVLPILCWHLYHPFWSYHHHHHHQHHQHHHLHHQTTIRSCVSVECGHHQIDPTRPFKWTRVENETWRALKYANGVVLPNFLLSQRRADLKPNLGAKSYLEVTNCMHAVAFLPHVSVHVFEPTNLSFRFSFFAPTAALVALMRQFWPERQLCQIFTQPKATGPQYFL